MILPILLFGLLGVVFYWGLWNNDDRLPSTLIGRPIPEFARGIGRWGRRLHQAAGGVMILMGLAMMTGRLSALAYWLLDTFPVLARIG